MKKTNNTQNVQSKPESYKILAFSQEHVLAEYMAFLMAMMAFQVDKDGFYDPAELQAARVAKCHLAMKLQADMAKPIVLKPEDGRITGLRQSLMSDILGVEYGRQRPVWQIVKVSHNVGAFKVHPLVLGTTPSEAEKTMRSLKEQILRRICFSGIVINKMMYLPLAASADAQKKGQLLMGAKPVMDQTSDARECAGNETEAMKRPDTAAEWLKRMAVLMTPSSILISGKSAQVRGYFIKAMLIGNGEDGPIHLRDIKMVSSIKVNRTFDRVRVIDGKYHPVEPMTTQQTQADGQMVRTDDPEIMEAVFDLEKLEKVDSLPSDFWSYKIVATTDVWKANKLFPSWDAFLAWVDKLEAKYPFIGYLRCVRMADDTEDLDEDETPETRELSRQLLQQMLLISAKEVAHLTQRTRRWLKKEKTAAGAYRKLTEANIPEDQRSDAAKVFAALPELMGERHIDQYLGECWTEKRRRAAMGKLRVSGSYPFLAQDPVAFLQVTVFGHDPEDPNLGVLGAEEFSTPGMEDKQEACVNRYPANAITAKVMVNRAIKAFAKLGGILVLSWHGDAIVRFDGDFDGDEALLVTWAWFVALMKRMLAMANFPLIVFEHGSKEEAKAFRTAENKASAMAAALQRSQEFNQVGIYSDLAMTLLALASEAACHGEDAKKEEYLRAASLAHVGAILCIDQVKGNDISPELLSALKKLQTYVRKRTHGLKPWNQQFHRPGKAVLPFMDCTADRIAACIMSDVGEWELQDAPVWSPALADLMMNDAVCSHKPYGAPVAHKFLQELNWRNYADDESRLAVAVRKGEPVAMKDLLVFFWRNRCALSYRMLGEGAEQSNELYRLCREVCMETLTAKSHIYNGRELSQEEKEALVVNAAIRMAFELDGHGNGIAEDKKASFAMFVVRVFAPDIAKNLERNAPLRALQFVELSEEDKLDMDFTEGDLTLE